MKVVYKWSAKHHLVMESIYTTQKSCYTYTEVSLDDNLK